MTHLPCAVYKLGVGVNNSLSLSIARIEVHERLYGDRFLQIIDALELP